MANKSSKSYKTSGVLFSVPLLPFAPLSLCGYIDLGTGSLVIQVVIAGFLGILFLLKVYWRRAKAFIRNLFSKDNKRDG